MVYDRALRRRLIPVADYCVGTTCVDVVNYDVANEKGCSCLRIFSMAFEKSYAFKSLPREVQGSKHILYF